MLIIKDGIQSAAGRLAEEHGIDAMVQSGGVINNDGGTGIREGRPQGPADDLHFWVYIFVSREHVHPICLLVAKRLDLLVNESGIVLIASLEAALLVEVGVDGGATGQRDGNPFLGIIVIKMPRLRSDTPLGFRTSGRLVRRRRRKRGLVRPGWPNRTEKTAETHFEDGFSVSDGRDDGRADRVGWERV